MLNLKEIDSVEFENIDWNDYPDFCDAYIVSATWKNGTDLTEAELDLLNFDHRDFVYDMLMKHLY